MTKCEGISIFFIPKNYVTPNFFIFLPPPSSHNRKVLPPSPPPTPTMTTPETTWIIPYIHGRPASSSFTDCLPQSPCHKPPSFLKTTMTFQTISVSPKSTSPSVINLGLPLTSVWQARWGFSGWGTKRVWPLWERKWYTYMDRDEMQSFIVFGDYCNGIDLDYSNTFPPMLTSTLSSLTLISFKFPSPFSLSKVFATNYAY